MVVGQTVHYIDQIRGSLTQGQGFLLRTHKHISIDWTLLLCYDSAMPYKLFLCIWMDFECWFDLSGRIEKKKDPSRPNVSLAAKRPGVPCLTPGCKVVVKNEYILERHLLAGACYKKGNDSEQIIPEL